MENASKALLIAGAILIAIILIAMGVRVINSTQGTTEATQSTMQSTEVTMFNNKFLGYMGANKSKAQAVALLNAVIANNSVNTAHQLGVKIQNVSYRQAGGTQSIDGTTGLVVTNINSLKTCINMLSVTTINVFRIEAQKYEEGYLTEILIYGIN